MIARSSQLLVTLLICIVLLGTGGCKSKKKALESKNAAAEKARIEQEAADKKKRDEEEARKREAEEKARAEAEARNKETKSEPAARLDQYFNAIAGSSNPTAANSSINEALSMFSSQQTPVLIVISEEGGMKDYDKPTTIKAYLDYLKDQKKNLNTITNLQFDAAGKISEVELTRKK